MPISVVCEHCKAKLNAPDAAAGKPVKCPKCGERLVVPAAAPAPEFEVVDEPTPPKKAPAPQAPAVKTDVVVDDDDEEDEKPRPAKKKPRAKADDDDDADEDDDRPRKKKGKKKAAAGTPPAVLIGAIVAGVLLLGGGGFAVYWFGFRDEKKETAANTSGPPNPYGGGMPGGPPPGMKGPPGVDGPGPAPSPGGNVGPQPGGTIKPLIETADPRSRQISSNNMKQIGLAFHNCEAVFGGMPAGIYDSSGKIGLSWRVAILPFVEQESLYKQFKLNEPWDSENNKKLIPQMPKIFAPPAAGPEGKSFYRIVGGPKSIYPDLLTQKGTPGQVAKGLSLSRVTDGTSNTALVFEAADPVEWTKPDDLVLSPGKPPRVGGVFADGFWIARGDGSSTFVRTTDPKQLEALFTATGGEIVDFLK
jgi:DNA-directed RNA polymerase subunit RPC12/RpoP